MSSFEIDKNPAEAKLDELFGLLAFAQLHLDTYGNPELTLETYASQLQELHSICQDRIIHATSNTVFAPVTEESGAISGAQIITGTAAGNLRGISVATFPDSDGDAKARLGIQLHYGQKKATSPVGNQHFEYFTFVPVEGATFYVEPFEDQKFEPDPNDVICASIDEAMLNVPIDFARLTSLFETEMIPAIDDDGDDAPGLQHTYYLKYLNQIASFRAVTAIAHYGIQRADERVVFHQEDDELFMLDVHSRNLKYFI